jgi:hypothetical protein
MILESLLKSLFWVRIIKKIAFIKRYTPQKLKRYQYATSVLQTP